VILGKVIDDIPESIERTAEISAKRLDAAKRGCRAVRRPIMPSRATLRVDGPMKLNRSAAARGLRHRTGTGADTAWHGHGMGQAWAPHAGQ
jgi:hypothetical protein